MRRRRARVATRLQPSCFVSIHSTVRRGHEHAKPVVIATTTHHLSAFPKTSSLSLILAGDRSLHTHALIHKAADAHSNASLLSSFPLLRTTTALINGDPEACSALQLQKVYISKYIHPPLFLSLYRSVRARSPSHSHTALFSSSICFAYHGRSVHCALLGSPSGLTLLDIPLSNQRPHRTAHKTFLLVRAGGSVL